MKFFAALENSSKISSFVVLSSTKRTFLNGAYTFDDWKLSPRPTGFLL